MIEMMDIEEAPKVSHEVALPMAGPMGNAMAFLKAGGTLDQLRDMLTLQTQFEEREALKAYNVAFSDFKAEAVRVLKARQVTDGPLKGKAYAELYSVVDAVTPALSKHGLSHSWKLTRDDKDWMEVTCTLKHVNGHSEVVSMGGPPDAGGAKNAIQARASTLTYLQRYTLKAICGVAEGGEDDDGNQDRKSDWLARVDEVATEDELRKVSREGTREFNAAKDGTGYLAFMTAVQKRGAEIKGGSHA